jgi:cobalamin-dependent methionine synthase I
MQLVTDIHLEIPREEVLRLLKYKKETTVINQKIVGLVDRAIEEGRALAQPKAVYADYDVKQTDEKHVFLNGISFSVLSKSAAHRLMHAKKVTFFVVTICHKLEGKIQEYVREGVLSSAAMLDAVGSAAVESVASYINALTDRRAKDTGFKTIQRFSPGYGDWDLKSQKELLHLLNASQIGISLTSSNLMQPEKSVSGVIGWTK